MQAARPLESAPMCQTGRVYSQHSIRSRRKWATRSWLRPSTMLVVVSSENHFLNSMRLSLVVGGKATGRRPQSTSRCRLTDNSLGAFHFSKAVLPLLLDALPSSEYPPTYIFTSATAAMKGSALCSSFATGKFAMRALAQSLAREFGPKGIHVNHAIIDGVIDIERTKDWKFEHEDAKIKPEAVSRPSPLFRVYQQMCAPKNADIRCSRLPTPTGFCILSPELASRTKSTSDRTLRSGRAPTLLKL